MKRKISFIIALLISLLPLNIVRIMLYRLIFGFKISKSKIGWLSIMNVNDLVLEQASIGSFNLFTGPFELRMEPKSVIGSLNMFRCGKWALEFRRSSLLKLGEESKIINQHYFDLFGDIVIDSNTIIAGVRSQFWTHGNMDGSVNICIGKGCYIGSGVKFAPGVHIPDESICALGSVVTKQFTEKNTLIAGVPAKVIKENLNWKKRWK